ERDYKRRQFEAERLDLAKSLRGILYQDLLFETDQAFADPAVLENYKSDFAKFKEYCLAEGFDWLPTSTEVVACYILHAAAHGMPPEQVGRSVNAIRVHHEFNESPLPDDPYIRAAFHFIKRHSEEEETTVVEEPPTNGSGVHH